MRRQAVFDTNVLVSALLSRRPDSATVQVVDAIATGDLVPLYSEGILAEYEDVLRRPKFPFSEGAIGALMGNIRRLGRAVSPSPTGETLPDPGDQVFYEAAVAGLGEGEAYLITGNARHFPRRWFIVTPAAMMGILAR